MIVPIRALISALTEKLAFAGTPAGKASPLTASPPDTS